jgi:hypothetical protein
VLNKQKFLDKIDDLIQLAESCVGKYYGDKLPYNINPSAATEFNASASVFIVSIYGPDSPFYRQFQVEMEHSTQISYKAAIGILNGIRKHIEQDWLESTRNKLSAEIFGDYLEMATHLNEQNFYIAAAVIAGTTLEERVRQLCIKFNLPTESLKSSGKTEALSVETMSGSLKTHYADGIGDVKLVTQYYGMRNAAAHGKWNNDTPQQQMARAEQVGIMIDAVRLFIKQNSL